MSAGFLRRTPTMAAGNGARGACSLRRNCTLAEGTRSGGTGSLRGYSTERICDRRRRSPCARNRGNLCYVIGQAGNRYTSILRNKRRCPRQCCRRTGRVCRTAVELSIAGAEGTWLARSGLRSDCGQPQAAFREQQREQKRQARVGHLHGGQMCMGFRCDCCCCLPGPCTGGTIAIDLNDCDDFSRCVRE